MINYAQASFYVVQINCKSLYNMDFKNFEFFTYN